MQSLIILQVFIFTEDGRPDFRFPENCLPPEFMSEHIRICTQFTDLQMETIDCNLNHYPCVSEHYIQWMESVKDACADFFLNTYNLQSIPGQRKMLPYKKVSNSCWQFTPLELSGRHSESWSRNLLFLAHLSQRFNLFFVCCHHKLLTFLLLKNCFASFNQTLHRHYVCSMRELLFFKGR